MKLLVNGKVVNEPLSLPFHSPLFAGMGYLKQFWEWTKKLLLGNVIMTGW